MAHATLTRALQPIALASLLAVVPATRSVDAGALPYEVLTIVADSARPLDRVPVAAPMWYGRLSGHDQGTVTMTLLRVGTAEDAIDPEWPVVTRWVVQAEDPARSFTAELFGHARASGSMVLGGMIGEGYHAGAEVQLELRGGRTAVATMRILPLAAR
jgi:hypothetical protein